MKQRFFRLIKNIIIILGILGGYALVRIYTDFRIPCIFYEITGYACPSCGVSRMCLNILKLDFAAAFEDNPIIFIMAPIILFVLVVGNGYYVYYGKTIWHKFDKLLYICIVILIGYGFWRNLA